MAVRIRLRRMGKKEATTLPYRCRRQPFPPDGRFVERLGYYNPVASPALLKVDLERLDYWLGEGATVSTTVGNLVAKARAGGDSKVALVDPVASNGNEAPEAEAPASEASASEQAAADNSE